MIDLSIIIVSYNTKEFLKNCIKSIIETTKNVKYEIIVVDNASTDGSASVISNIKYPTSSIRQVFDSEVAQTRGAQDKNIKWIQNDKNLGFSRANNIGIRSAKGRYILFLNSDTIVYDKTLEIMVKFMDEYKDAGAATCKVMMPNNKLDDAAHRGFPTPWNSFCHFCGFSKIFPKSKIFADYSLGWMDINSVHEIDACAGAFMIVRSIAGEEIKWWDEDYFWYGEDLDFCYRLKKAGWKVYYAPEVSILHYKGVSGGIKNHSKHLTTADSATKKRAAKARFEAMRIFYKKHYQNIYPKFITFLVYKGIDLRELIS